MHNFVDLAVSAAQEAGELLRKNFGKPLEVAAFEAHDIKLELDVRSQEMITRRILDSFPDHAIYGEEGIAGNQQSDYQWIVDPIDGTVNFFYSLPHFCISIALRHHEEIIVGVIYDPMRDELWRVGQNEPATMNGELCAVSQRANIGDAIVSVGFAKSKATIDVGLPLFEQMVFRARKCRMLGSAALDMAYVASGRLDAYIEQVVSLWDIAAGKMLVESAGGKVLLKERTDIPDKFSIAASSGLLDLGPAGK